MFPISLPSSSLMTSVKNQQPTSLTRKLKWVPQPLRQRMQKNNLLRWSRLHPLVAWPAGAPLQFSRLWLSEGLWFSPSLQVVSIKPAVYWFACFLGCRETLCPGTGGGGGRGVPRERKDEAGCRSLGLGVLSGHANLEAQET